MVWKSLLFHYTPYVLVFVTIVIQSSISSADDTKRQNLIPSARLGREVFLFGEDTPVELHQNFEENEEFSSSEPDYIDSEIFLNAESDDANTEDTLRSEATLNRRKRSLSKEQPTENKPTSQQISEDLKSKWNKETQSNVFNTVKRSARSRLIFIPRIGKKSYDSYANKRAIFIPRIGKKSFGEEDFSEDKRAIFIPRIGKRSYVNNPEMKKAIFIPRIGKKSFSEEDFSEDKRAIFIPGIGKKSYMNNPEMKKAIFIPRIGRGAAIMSRIRYNPQNKSNGRVVFIPRIG